MKLDIYRLVKVIFITLCGSSALLFIWFTIMNSEPHDFGVYYYSARAALGGEPIYKHYGLYDLPYWYFPWLAWFYMPLAALPFTTAYTLYIVISLVCASITINYLLKKTTPHLRFLESFFVFCAALILCWLLFRVGQMDFILLAVAVLIMHLIEINKPYGAGLLVPVLLFKPHLFLVFLPYALYKGGRSFFVSTALACLTLLFVSFALIPEWPLHMLQMLAQSGQRTDNIWSFTTLPNMLGMQENWSGTANLPFTFGLFLIALAVMWRLRALPTFPFLALALAASLFCAPRAYSYNFPLLLPAMIWITADLPNPFFLLFWLLAAMAAFLFLYSTGAYMIVLVILAVGLHKGYRDLAYVRAQSQAVNL